MANIIAIKATIVKEALTLAFVRPAERREVAP